jgi:hypothetical protein
MRHLLAWSVVAVGIVVRAAVDVGSLTEAEKLMCSRLANIKEAAALAEQELRLVRTKALAAAAETETALHEVGELASRLEDAETDAADAADVAAVALMAAKERVVVGAAQLEVVVNECNDAAAAEEAEMVRLKIALQTSEDEASDVTMSALDAKYAATSRLETAMANTASAAKQISRLNKERNQMAGNIADANRRASAAQAQVHQSKEEVKELLYSRDLLLDLFDVLTLHLGLQVSMNGGAVHALEESVAGIATLLAAKDVQEKVRDSQTKASADKLLATIEQLNAIEAELRFANTKVADLAAAMSTAGELCESSAVAFAEIAAGQLETLQTAETKLKTKLVSIEKTASEDAATAVAIGTQLEKTKAEVEVCAATTITHAAAHADQTKRMEAAAKDAKESAVAADNELEALKTSAADAMQAAKETVAAATAELEALKVQIEADSLAATEAAAAATIEFEALKVRAADEVQATKEAASVATAALEALKLETEANNLAATAAAAVKEAAAAAAATAELEGIKVQTDANSLAAVEVAEAATIAAESRTVAMVILMQAASKEANNTLEAMKTNCTELNNRLQAENQNVEAVATAASNQAERFSQELESSTAQVQALSASIKMLVKEASTISAAASAEIADTKSGAADVAQKAADAVTAAAAQLSDAQAESVNAVNVAARATENLAIELAKITFELASSKKNCAAAIQQANEAAAAKLTVIILLTHTNEPPNQRCVNVQSQNRQEGCESLTRKLLRWKDHRLQRRRQRKVLC